MTMRPILAASALVLAACGGKPSTTPSPAADREVRFLEATDVALPGILFAAAKHVFDPNASQPIFFGGVYVNKRFEPSLTSDVGNFINRNGGFQSVSKPGDCNVESVDRPTAPRAPTTPGATGGAPNPRSQPKRATSTSLCEAGNAFSYGVSFTSFRVAADTAYVEEQISGASKASTKCLALTVDKEAGGWKPLETTPSKVGQCGK